MENILVLPQPLQYQKKVYCEDTSTLAYKLQAIGIQPFAPWSVVLFKIKQGTSLYFKAWWNETYAIFSKNRDILASSILVFLTALDYTTRPLFASIRPHWYRQCFNNYMKHSHTAIPIMVRDMADRIHKEIPEAKVDIESFDDDPLLIASLNGEEYTIAVW